METSSLQELDFDANNLREKTQHADKKRRLALDVKKLTKLKPIKPVVGDAEVQGPKECHKCKKTRTTNLELCEQSSYAIHAVQFVTVKGKAFHRWSSRCALNRVQEKKQRIKDRNSPRGALTNLITTMKQERGLMEPIPPSERKGNAGKLMRDFLWQFMALINYTSASTGQVLEYTTHSIFKVSPDRQEQFPHTEKYTPGHIFLDTIGTNRFMSALNDSRRQLGIFMTAVRLTHTTEQALPLITPNKRAKERLRSQFCNQNKREASKNGARRREGRKTQMRREDDKDPNNVKQLTGFFASHDFRCCVTRLRSTVRGRSHMP